MHCVSMRAKFLEALGGEAGCKRLSAEFYARVGNDPVLRPLFPGKSLRCATEEFAAFLIQFLHGDEDQTQYRWWLSLRESHARFRISVAERRAWLELMRATIEALPLDKRTREALHEFFLHSSAYVIGQKADEPEHDELAACWREQRTLDDVISAINASDSDEALALVPQVGVRPSVFVGVLARMIQTDRVRLHRFVLEAAENEPSLATQRFAGRSLLHFACGSGCVEVVALLLRLGTDADIQDRGGHTPLYAVANECASETGAQIVRMLVQAGAQVSAGGGITRATPLHMAARRGNVEIARALLDCGAEIEALDSKGVTPLERAINCRRHLVSQLLLERGAASQRT